MRKKAIILIIYLVGCACAYKYAKHNFTHYPDRDTWTKGDRAISIVLSTLSWGTVAAMGLVQLIEIGASDKEPASW